MNAIIAFALRMRALMVALFVLVMIGGVTAFVRLNIEAYPDPVPPLVDIVTQNPGQSAEEIERYITIPIEVDVAVAPYLTAMRTISLFGLSDVKLQFTYDLTYEEAEQKVLNRLSQLPALQNQAQPTISPWSPIGEIYRYQLVGPPGYSVMDLKTIQDWVIARRFRAVPGVIDVTGWGGKTKTFEIQIDRQKLVAYGLTLPQVLQTLSNSNINVGGNTVNIGQQAAVVRGVGLIRSMSDIRNTMLTAANGNPVFLSDIAEIVVGNKPRLGIAGRDEQDDIVQGIVLMRRGQQSLPTIRRVEAEVERLADSPRITRMPNARVYMMTLASTMRPKSMAPTDRRHHGGKHLSTPCGRRAPQRGRRDSCPFRPQGKTRNDLSCGDRGQPRHLFFRRDHNRRLHSAVHAERGRGPHIQPDGENLRLCAGRRAVCHVYGRACLECLPAP
jgi:Cu/Ag efflux pump CusA